MIATLPMYDRPETRAATDRFWDLIRTHVQGAPEHLSRDGFHWLSPDLLLSQTCSLPYRTGLQDHVSIIATPVHSIPCPAGFYFSNIVLRKDDDRTDLTAFAGARLAINSPLSQSGWAAIDGPARQAGIGFGEILETGSHQESARAVAEGRADICSIDAVTWKMIERWDPFARDLRVLCHTDPTPALPYITALETDPHPIQEALVHAVGALSAEDQETLCLIDVTHIPREHYTSMPIPPAPVTTLSPI